VVAQVERGDDHEPGEGGEPGDQLRGEPGGVDDGDQDRGGMPAGEGVTLDPLQGVQQGTDRPRDQQAREFRAVVACQEESGPEGRDRQVADEGEVVGEEEGKDGAVERLFLPPLVEDPQQDEREDIVGQVRELHHLGDSRAGETLQPDAGVHAEQGAVEPAQDGIPVPRIQLRNEAQCDVDDQDRHRREERRKQRGKPPGPPQGDRRLEGQEDEIGDQRLGRMFQSVPAEKDENHEAQENDGGQEVRRLPGPKPLHAGSVRQTPRPGNQSVPPRQGPGLVGDSPLTQRRSSPVSARAQRAAGRTATSS